MKIFSSENSNKGKSFGVVSLDIDFWCKIEPKSNRQKCGCETYYATHGKLFEHRLLAYIIKLDQINCPRFCECKKRSGTRKDDTKTRAFFKLKIISL